MSNPYTDQTNGLAANLRNETFSYDERGKVLQVNGHPGTTTSMYAPMGGLARVTTSMPYDVQTLTVDAMGNTAVKESSARGETGTVTWSRQSHTYQGAGTNRLLATFTVKSDSTFLARDTTMYDAAGNRIRYSLSTLLGTEIDARGRYVNVNLEESTRSYYDAVGQLRAVDRRRCVARTPYDLQPRCAVWEPTPGRDPGTFEEYRYDALGRRVAVRSRFDATQCSSARPEACRSRVTRTVWDGDQLLLELRATGESTDYHTEWVAYTQGPGIDAPLMVRVNRGSTHDIIPLANWRGLYEAGVFPDGSTYREDLNLKKIAWPAASYTAYFDYVPAPEEPEPVWLGSLMSHKRDASGQLYMRNRYYDPQSGRFTQEDPIGLAGGLNLYGFGGGDPVNYTDPYGLCILPRRICNALAEAGDKAVPFWADRAASAGSRSERYFATGMGLLASLCTSDTCAATDRVLRGDLIGGARGALEGLRGGVVGHSNADVRDQLMPGGTPIGTPGSRDSYRNMTGGATAATAMFAQLTAGGTQVANSNYPGTLMSVDGGTIGYRTTMTRSPGTEATIDVNVPTVPEIQKLKFNP